MAVGSLNEAEALAIAYDIKQNPHDEKVLTDYLSEDEKKLVKVALKYLYASDKAMRTFCLKVKYLDAQREAYRAQLKATSTAIRAYAQKVRFTNLSRGYNQIMKMAEANLAKCTKNEQQVIRNLNKQINAIWSDYQDAAAPYLKVHKDKNGERTGVTGPWRLMHRLYSARDSSNTVNTFIEMNKYILANGLKDPMAREDLAAFKRQRAKIAKQLGVISPGLAKATTHFYKEFDKITDACRKAFNVPLKTKSLGVQVNIARGKMYAWQGSSVEETANAMEAKRKSDEAGERLQLAGMWYIVAAMGDVLTELAQNLAY